MTQTFSRRSCITFTVAADDYLEGLLSTYEPRSCQLGPDSSPDQPAQVVYLCLPVLKETESHLSGTHSNTQGAHVRNDIICSWSKPGQLIKCIFGTPGLAA